MKCVQYTTCSPEDILLNQDFLYTKRRHAPLMVRKKVPEIVFPNDDFMLMNTVVESEKQITLNKQLQHFFGWYKMGPYQVYGEVYDSTL